MNQIRLLLLDDIDKTSWDVPEMGGPWGSSSQTCFIILKINSMFEKVIQSNYINVH